MVAATQFTAYMALMNFSEAIGKKLAGSLRLTWHWDTGDIFCLIGVLQIAVVLLLPLIDPHQTRRVLGDGDATETDAPA